MKKTCIFLLHGSRRPKQGEIEGIIDSVVLPDDMESVVAYLELQEPAFSDVLKMCPATDEFHILPLFVLEGRHVREDIPEITNELKKQAPGKTFVVHDHLGQWDLFKDMLTAQLKSL